MDNYYIQSNSCHKNLISGKIIVEQLLFCNGIITTELNFKRDQNLWYISWQQKQLELFEMVPDKVRLLQVTMFQIATLGFKSKGLKSWEVSRAKQVTFS